MTTTDLEKPTVAANPERAAKDVAMREELGRAIRTGKMSVGEALQRWCEQHGICEDAIIEVAQEFVYFETFDHALEELDAAYDCEDGTLPDMLDFLDSIARHFPAG